MKPWLLCTSLFFSFSVFSQTPAPVTQEDTLPSLPAVPHKNYTSPVRKWIAGGITAAGYGGSFLFLSQAWYKDYPKTGLHSFNDAGEWQQVDKVGHGWTAYHTSRITSDLWRWAGVSEKTALWLGTGSSMLYMLSIEYLDGRSAEWGWSWADVGANFTGAALYVGQ
ncbi:MAG TPA: DUF2279 domain-containing protein, partial [Flavisolibacter sp.]